MALTRERCVSRQHMAIQRCVIPPSPDGVPVFLDRMGGKRADQSLLVGTKKFIHSQIRLLNPGFRSDLYSVVI